MAIDSQNNSIVLRPAVPEDAAAIARLGARVFTLTFGHSVSPDQLRVYLDESYSLQATARDISDPAKDMIVATKPSQTAAADGDHIDARAAIVGFALLTRGTSEPCLGHLAGAAVELQRIYVNPAHHGNGVGRLLAERLENMARAQGFEHMWLGVWEENYRAQRVYEKLGYRLVGSHDFVIGEVVQTDHIMVKDL